MTPGIYIGVLGGDLVEGGTNNRVEDLLNLDVTPNTDKIIVGYIGNNTLPSKFKQIKDSQNQFSILLSFLSGTMVILLLRFDKRITDFAEEKFQMDGIQVKTRLMVTKMSDKEISLKESSIGVTKNLSYGMVVWSTGIGTHPVIMDFMKQIGQVAAQQGKYLAKWNASRNLKVHLELENKGNTKSQYKSWNLSDY
ncbi:putative NADH:ubiquinone reductase [Tanacetum coccineum]